MTIRSFSMRLAADAGQGVAPERPPLPLLVIDDRPADLEAALVHLVRAGFATAVAHDGDGALRRVRAELTRLVVSELYVASSEGPCVVAALKRERARLPRLRILVLTRHVSARDQAWALAAGADCVLHKDAGAGALVRELRRLDALDDERPTLGNSIPAGGA